MTTITITIAIDAGDAMVTVGTAQNGGPAAYVPPFADELVPLPEGAMALPGDPVQPTAFRGAAMGGPNPDLCPVHHMPWKTVPAGVSKSSGKSYSAFRACPERGCDQRPPA